MRMIDADALCDKIDNEMQKYDAYDSCQAKIVGGLLDAEELVREMPTIEAAPVKHGRWKGEGMGDYSCSLCTEIVCGNEYNYCPNCGATMDGGADHERS